MDNMHLVDLTDSEIDEVSGGIAWVPIIAGGIFLGGLAVEFYNAYQDEAKAAAVAKKKATPPPKV